MVAVGVFVLLAQFGDGLWTSERVPWLFERTADNYIVIDTRIGTGTCERPGTQVVTETEHAVRIEAFREDRVWLYGGYCEGIGGGGQWVRLDEPLGLRRLEGCTWSLEGTQPADIDCRRWP